LTYELSQKSSNCFGIFLPVKKRVHGSSWYKNGSSFATWGDAAKDQNRSWNITLRNKITHEPETRGQVFAKSSQRLALSRDARTAVGQGGAQ